MRSYLIVMASVALAACGGASASGGAGAPSMGARGPESGVRVGAKENDVPGLDKDERSLAEAPPPAAAPPPAPHGAPEGGVDLGTLGRGAGGRGSGEKQPQLKPGAATVTGKLDPELVRRVVRREFGRFRLCYDAGLRKDPSLAGRISVKFVVEKDGTVSHVSSAGTSLTDEGVMSCVLRSYYALMFPKPEGGGSVTVVFPIDFTPGDDASPARTSP